MNFLTSDDNDRLSRHWLLLH